MNNQVIFTTSLLFIIAISFYGANSSGEDGVPSNPCAMVLCMTNTNCIAVPDIQDCKPDPNNDPPCPLKAMCIPNGAQLPAPYDESTDGEYCGTKGEKCQPGYKCDLVYRFCPINVHPCLPVLGCVPVPNKQPLYKLV